MDCFSVHISIDDVKNQSSASFLLVKSVADVCRLLEDAKSHSLGGDVNSSQLPSTHTNEKDFSDKDSLSSHKIQLCIQNCLADPKIVHCDWFRSFLTTALHDTNQQVEDNNSSPAWSSSPSSAHDFLLQPIESEVAYIPRRGSVISDHRVGAGESLVWSYSTAASTEIAFRILFQATTDSASAPDTDMTSKHEVERAFEAHMLGKESHAHVREVDPSESSGAEAGTGCFHASEKGIVRLIFDNSRSLFRGNYIEHRVQSVSESALQAARQAAEDVAAAGAQRSELYAAVLRSGAEDCFHVRVEEDGELDGRGRGRGEDGDGDGDVDRDGTDGELKVCIFCCTSLYSSAPTHSIH